MSLPTFGSSIFTDTYSPPPQMMVQNTLTSTGSIHMMTSEQIGTKPSIHAHGPSGPHCEQMGQFAVPNSLPLNITYHQQYEQQIQSLQAANARLQAENQVLLATKISYQDAFTRLASTLKLSSDPTTTANLDQITVSHTNNPTVTPPPLPALDEKEYPQVRFWNQDKYKLWDKEQSAKRQEDENGQLLNKDTVSAILRKMRAIWQGFKHRGVAPATWGAATDEVKTQFYSEVELAFPQLRLCANSWKAEAVATARYSSWAQTYLKDSKESGKRKIKSEGDSESVEPESKRLKTESGPSEDISDMNFTAQEALASTSAVSTSVELVTESTSNSSPLAQEIPIVHNPLAALRKDKETQRNVAAGNTMAPIAAPQIMAPAAPITSSAVMVPIQVTQPPPMAAPAAPITSPTVSTAAVLPMTNVSTALETVTPVATPAAATPAATLSTSNASTGPTTTVASTAEVLPAAPTPVANSEVGQMTSTTEAAAGVGQLNPATAAIMAVATTGPAWQPHKRKTGRTLCAYRWITKVSPWGTGTEFAAYWKGLPDARKKQYEDEYKTLLATNRWTGYTVEVTSALGQGTLY